jgi:hypothetical protein
MRRAQQRSLAAAAEGVVERTDPRRAALPDAALALEVCGYDALGVIGTAV